MTTRDTVWPETPATRGDIAPSRPGASAGSLITASSSVDAIIDGRAQLRRWPHVDVTMVVLATVLT